MHSVHNVGIGFLCLKISLSLLMMQVSAPGIFHTSINNEH